jgi:hypothetical protein
MAEMGFGKDILLFRFTRRILFFIELHNTMQTLTIRTHNLYEYTYVNPILKSPSEGLNTRQIWRFPDWCLVIDRSTAYHLTLNAGKS